jgi:hypothetical protein
LLLAHEDLSDLKLLAARADTLNTHRKDGNSTVVNTVAYHEINAPASGGGLPANRYSGGSRGVDRGSKGDRNQ